MVLTHRRAHLPALTTLRSPRLRRNHQNRAIQPTPIPNPGIALKCVKNSAYFEQTRGLVGNISKLEDRFLFIKLRLDGPQQPSIERVLVRALAFFINYLLIL